MGSAHAVVLSLACPDTRSSLSRLSTHTKRRAASRVHKPPRARTRARSRRHREVEGARVRVQRRVDGALDLVLDARRDEHDGRHAERRARQHALLIIDALPRDAEGGRELHKRLRLKVSEEAQDTAGTQQPQAGERPAREHRVRKAPRAQERGDRVNPERQQND
eukprot:2093637-Prymnesium_polylepis.2